MKLIRFGIFILGYCTAKKPQPRPRTTGKWIDIFTAGYEMKYFLPADYPGTPERPSLGHFGCKLVPMIDSADDQLTRLREAGL